MVSGIPLLLLIGLSIALIVFLCARLKINPFLSLLIACLFLGITTGMEWIVLVDSIQSGFGGIMKYIGLVVVLGSVIGVFLEQSGGALRIAKYIVELVGRKRSLSAMSIIGAVISIPVFCDSGFILLSGLTERVSQISKQNRAGLTLALATGLYTTHTLVPPTPGPLAAAGNLGASDFLGTMILVGIVTSIPILLLSQWLSKRLSKNIDSVESSVIESIEEVEMPALWKAFLPLVLPIILISMGTILPFIGIESTLIGFLGNPLIALFIGSLMCLFFLRPKSSKEWKENLEKAVRISGPILIITGAGGAFGGVLKSTALSETVSEWLGSGMSSEVLVIFLVFIIAAVLKTAQGSSTSAMVISSSLLAPLIPVLGWETPLDFAFAVLAIGGGAMCISHYNDSYFWVVSKFGKIEHYENYRSFSMITGMMGVGILIISILFSQIF